MRRLGIFAFSLVLALAHVPDAFAQRAGSRSSPRSDSASDLFQQSVRAYREGRFQDAVDLLTRARGLKAEPVLLYNLGRAYEALGKPSLAADAYSQFLQEDPKAQDRLALEGRIATLRKQAEQDDARQKEAAAPPPSVPSPAPVVAPPPPASPPEPERSGIETAAPWIVGGVGLAGLGTGLAFGLVAHSHESDAASEPVQMRAQSDYDSARHSATISNVAFIAGGVLVATAAVWLLLRATSHDTPRSTALAF